MNGLHQLTLPFRLQKGCRQIPKIGAVLENVQLDICDDEISWHVIYAFPGI